MRELGLHFGTKLGEGMMLPLRDEQRIIAEPVFTRHALGNRPFASAFVNLFIAEPVAKDEHAAETGVSLIRGDTFQFVQKPIIVGCIITMRPRKTGGMDARRSVECLYFQSAVISQGPESIVRQMGGERGCFQACVSFEAIFAFLHRRHLAQILGRSQIDIDLCYAQQIAYLLTLVGVITG